jgi:hypothetical protein
MCNRFNVLTNWMFDLHCTLDFGLSTTTNFKLCWPDSQTTFGNDCITRARKATSTTSISEICSDWTILKYECKAHTRKFKVWSHLWIIGALHSYFKIVQSEHISDIDVVLVAFRARVIQSFPKVV